MNKKQCKKGRFWRSFIVAAIVLSATVDPGGASQGVAVTVSAPVPVAEPVAAAAPFFYGGFWWRHDGSNWHRSHSGHGPWGDPYLGRIPDEVLCFHRDHYGDRRNNRNGREDYY
ncbi:MAG: hypothetical protein P4L42_10030 [Desulfocapsaceae bacterium]|nr:hypothetical protein [Desulfocapsaceae bacterium]